MEGQVLVQGYSPKIKFWDCQRLVQAGLQNCVPAGCFENVLRTDEWALWDPAGGHQTKFIAPGAGTIRASAKVAAGTEFVTLTRVGPLCPRALAEIRDLTAEQDRRGYTVAPDVYGGSPPAERTLTPAPCAQPSS